MQIYALPCQMFKTCFFFFKFVFFSGIWNVISAMMKLYKNSLNSSLTHFQPFKTLRAKEINFSSRNVACVVFVSQILKFYFQYLSICSCAYCNPPSHLVEFCLVWGGHFCWSQSGRSLPQSCCRRAPSRGMECCTLVKNEARRNEGHLYLLLKVWASGYR